MACLLASAAISYGSTSTPFVVTSSYNVAGTHLHTATGYGALHLDGHDSPGDDRAAHGVARRSACAEEGDLVCVTTVAVRDDTHGAFVPLWPKRVVRSPSSPTSRLPAGVGHDHRPLLHVRVDPEVCLPR